MCPCVEYLGYAAALYLSYKVLSFVMGNLYCKVLARPLDVARLGEWALVTGSTDGIGKAYALALAKKGLNIVLVSRSPYKLQNTAAEIESKYKVKTKIVDVDFTDSDKEYIPKVEKEIAGLDIGVLVNNVGMAYDVPAEFLSIEDGDNFVRNMVAVNITSVNAMTRAVMPAMVERGRGAVINISSMVCQFPGPLYAVYAASKAYVDNFSTNLEIEYRRKGIVVQSVLPGYVVSKMSKLRKPSLMAPSPEVYVRSALSRLGVETRTNGYWTHTVMQTFINWMPLGLSQRLLLSQIGAIRAKALKRKAKEQ